MRRRLGVLPDARGVSGVRELTQRYAKVPLAGYRAPVRPLPMSVLAADDEPSEMTADWDVWFGIPTQWIPYDDIGSDREPYHIANLTDTMHI